MEEFTNEEYTNVKPVQVDYKCPKCHKGYLRPLIMTYGNPKVEYPHHCNNKDCDYKKILPVRYPYIKFVPKDWEFTIYEGFCNNVENTIRNPKYRNSEITIIDKTKIIVKEKYVDEDDIKNLKS